MAKGNLFLGFGRGKVGDVVFYHSQGEQISRARNRHPKNPQTALQLLQRVVMKTVSTAYSMLMPITDHSFEGFSTGAENQARFAKRNVTMLREMLADEINSGDASVILGSSKYNFSSKFSTLPEMDRFIVSEGTLPKMDAHFSGYHLLLNPNNSSLGTQPGPVAVTYNDLVSYLGLQKGDQITAVILTCDDTKGGDNGLFNSIHIGRFILEPSTGNMSAMVADASGLIDPNERNEGNMRLTLTSVDDKIQLEIILDNLDGDSPASQSIAGGFVIASRLSSVGYKRSPEKIDLRDWGGGSGNLTQAHNVDLLSDAVMSFMTEANSSLYLNQAM